MRGQVDYIQDGEKVILNKITYDEMTSELRDLHELLSKIKQAETTLLVYEGGMIGPRWYFLNAEEKYAVMASDREEAQRKVNGWRDKLSVKMPLFNFKRVTIGEFLSKTETEKR